MTIQPRDYRETAGIIGGDINKFIEQHPDNFDIRLFKAKRTTLETVTPESDVVGSIEADERLFEYDDPIERKAVFLPFEFDVLVALDDGSMADEDDETPVVMLINEPEIPRQSVVQLEEYVNDTDIERRSLCIMKSEVVAQGPPVAMKHFLIPFSDEEELLQEDVT